eukprot:2883104-Amphidinium_carterae.1
MAGYPIAERCEVSLFLSFTSLNVRVCVGIEAVANLTWNVMCTGHTDKRNQNVEETPCTSKGKKKKAQLSIRTSHPKCHHF